MRARFLECLFLSVLFILGPWTSARAQSYAASVQAMAQVQSAPPKITLSWQTVPNTTGFSIWRKLKGATTWGTPLTTLDGSAQNWSDNSISAQVSYEYKIRRSTTNQGYGYAYLNSGINLPMVEFRGKLILLVDTYFSTSLSAQITQLQADLEGDGWTVLRHDVDRNASVTGIRSIVVGDYNADPQNTKMLFLLGHVPVPYSGSLAPDGHGDHWGAWSADTYYADVNGNWTDNSVYATGAMDPRNRNTPGDGKFDQSIIPSSVELMVGRVDFANLPTFSQNETTLMGNYLTKLHNWKVKAFTATGRGLVDDNFQGNSDAFAANAYRGFSPLVGPSNVSDLDYFSSMAGQSYLWSYGCGGGYWDSANGVGNTAGFASSNLKSVFTILFGSYFGDFDAPNDFMRASLASGKTLTCFWAGYPNWFFHHMGMGETIGYATALTQNNGNALYEPANPSAGRVHIALMGDPSLRMTITAPPANVAAGVNGNQITVTWSASPDNVIGYHVYRYLTSTQTWQRVSANTVIGNSFVDNVSGASGTIRYMVRALKLQQTPSGTYYDLSIGAFGQTTGGGQVPDCLGVPGGTAIPGSSCNDGMVCTVNDTWNAACQCVGTFLDSDGDGVCNAQDACPGVPGQPGSACNDGSPCTVNDVLNAACQCVGTYLDNDGDGICNAQDNCPNTPGQIGSTCNDGNNCTVNDRINADCQCAGTYMDNDGDGICNAQDNCPNTPGQVGSSCDDGQACTVNDVINANCQCAGTPLEDADGDGICDALDECPGTPGTIGSPCNDGFGCTTNDVINADCICAGTPVADWDGDGICNAQDNCPFIPGVVGSPCDDGHACTLNDVLNANCQCTGTYADTDGDGICDALDGCPTEYGTVGSACNDGDPCTSNDRLTSDCQCAGTPSGDMDDDGICDPMDYCQMVPGTLGSPCDDGDPCTVGDALDVNCACTGTASDTDGDGTCDALDGCPLDPGKTLPGICGCGNLEPGTPCNDGQGNTVNDVIGGNCQCVGTLLDCEGTPGGSALPGTSCDDGDPGTGNDAWTDDCQCQGEPLDCLGVPNGPAVPGTACNDQDPGTGNDTWTAACQCIGALYDCQGSPGGPSLPGTPCNDGDAGTGDDVWSTDCTCAGTPIDCAGVIGGTALVDGCGTCAGGTTGIIPDPDLDLDNVLDCLDNCPTLPNPAQLDIDGDGVGNLCDNCPWVFNPDQMDADQNGIGDACSGSLAIPEEQTPGFTIIPNPVDGAIRLVGAPHQAVGVQVMDVAGSLVREIPFKEQLDLSDLASGAYTLIVLDVHGERIAEARLLIR